MRECDAVTLRGKRYCGVLLWLFLALLGSTVAEASQDDVGKSAWRLVNYWSEWCSPCRKEIPMLNALREELALQGVQLVGVNFDDDPRDVTLNIAKSLGIKFPTLTSDEIAQAGLPVPNVMPTTYVLTPGGHLADTLVGLQSREQILARLSRLGVFVGNPP